MLYLLIAAAAAVALFVLFPLVMGLLRRPWPGKPTAATKPLRWRVQGRFADTPERVSTITVFAWTGDEAASMGVDRGMESIVNVSLTPA